MDEDDITTIRVVTPPNKVVRISVLPEIILSGTGGGGAAFTLNATTRSVSIVAGGAIGLTNNLSTISLSAPVATNFSLNGSSSSVSLVAGNNITLNSGASSITIVGASAAAGGTQSFSGGGTSITGNQISVALVGGNNISLGSASGAGSLTLTIHGSSNALNNVSLLNASSGALSLSAGAGIGIGQANSTITISASASANVVSAFGTGVATSTGTIVLVAGNNITLNTGASSISIVGPTVPAATNFSLNASSSSVSLSAGAGIGIGQANSTITVSASVQTSSVSLTALGNTTGSSSGTFSNLLNISGAGAVSVGAGAGSITISSPLATNFSLNGSSSSVSLVAGAGIGFASNASTITISNTANAFSTVSLSASGNTTGATSSGTMNNVLAVSGMGGVSVGAGNGSISVSGPSQTTLVAGSNISLTSGGSSITIIGTGPAVKLIQNFDIGRAAGTIVSKAGTITGTAGVGSSLFLSRVTVPGVMSLTEIDVAMSIGFPATNQGAGTMSRSMVLYSFGNSTSLASVASISGTSAWNTGTSTAGASTSLTQFQGGWSAPFIQPFTFASTSIAPGEYVVGQLFNFAQGSSTWTLNFYGDPDAVTFLASAATNLTSATLGALSSGGLAAGSGITGISTLASSWWPMMASQGFTGSNSMSAYTLSAASSAATSNTKAANVSIVAASASAQLNIQYAISNSASLPLFSIATVAGSVIGTSGSLGAVTNVALGALNSSTLAQLTLPNFGYIGTGSTTSGFPTAFMAGIMSTGAVPVAITLTSAAVTYSGSAAFQQPWFALIGA